MTTEEKDFSQSENENVEETQDEGADNEKESTENDKFLDQKRRAEKAEKEARELKEKIKRLSGDDEDLPEQEQEKAPNVVDKEYLRLTRKLDDDELEALENMSEELGIPEKKLLKSKVWETHLEKLQEQKEAEARTPSPSGSKLGSRSDSKFKAGMTRDEHKEAWNKANGR